MERGTEKVATYLVRELEKIAQKIRATKKVIDFLGC